MANVSIRDMLEAGIHFGHQTRFWNPKMRPYIFGERNKIHIIDLETTLPLYKDALNYLGRVAAEGLTVLFVGTKRAAQESIALHAQRCGMPYVNRRWLGGMLTNFRTVKQSIRRMKDLEAMIEEGRLDRLSKKEGLSLRRELAKLENGIGGIKNMEKIPDALFLIDVGHENIAVAEAVKLEIPVVAVVDTNNTPEGVNYVIPGNDDAMRAIDLYVTGVADAIVEGKELRRRQVASEVGSSLKTDEADSDDSKGARKKSRKPKPAITVKEKSIASSSDAGEAEAASKEAPVDDSVADDSEPE